MYTVHVVGSVFTVYPPDSGPLREVRYGVAPGTLFGVLYYCIMYILYTYNICNMYIVYYKMYINMYACEFKCVSWCPVTTDSDE